MTNNYVKINNAPVVYFDDTRPSSVQAALDHIEGMTGRVVFYRAFRTHHPIQGSDLVGFDSPEMLQRHAGRERSLNHQALAAEIEERIPTARNTLEAAWTFTGG